MTGRRGSRIGPTALFAAIVLGSVLSACNAKISDKRLCYDKDCSVIVSVGKTTLPYHSNDHDLLSFPANIDVKVYSKAAGRRKDLWGVEINGKRGYVPKSFIREVKVYHGTLEHIVPIKEFNDKKDENFAQEAENLIEKSEQEDQSKTELPEAAVNKSLEDSIVPHQVSPSYDNVYDGTVLPQDEYTESPPPSYSTQTLQDNVKKEEEVRLNIYPNLLKSTFSAISGILSNTEESSEEGSIEFTSSEKVISEEVVQNTPKIEKADESSLNFEETKITVPETILSENKSNVFTEKLVLEEVNDIDSNNETDTSVEPEIKKTISNSETGTLVEQELNEVVSNTETDTSVEAKVNEVVNNIEKSDAPVESKDNEVVSNIEKTDKSVEFELNEVSSINTDTSVEPEVNKTVIQSESNKDEENTGTKSNEENVINPEQKVESTVETINLVDSVKSEGNVKNSSPLVDASTEKIYIPDTAEEVKPVHENLQNNIVPNEEKTVVVTDNSVTQNDTSAVTPTDETVLNKQTVNDTSVNSSNVGDSIIPEVPLTQEFKEESATAPNESFLPYKDALQTNFSENESKPIDNNIKINDNVIVSNVFVEESNLIDSSLNFKQQLEVNDNLVDSNNNVIEENSYTTNIPAHLQNDSAVENAESVDSSHENIVDIPSTSSFGEFLGNRNLLNAGKGFQYDDYSEEIGVDKVILDKAIQTTTSSGSDENLSSEGKQGEENVSFEEVPPTNNVEKIVLSPETCNNKNYDHSKHQYYADENAMTNARKMADNSETLLYVCITAVTTLLFSLGYYFIENKRRDAYLIAKINNLEKDLMVTRKECIMLDENFKSTKTKLDSIEDESFGSNEMVLSLKAELVASENTRVELEEQITLLEKELESTSEAGLELERMLREILSSHNEENNPLAQSIEDLQVRLNEQQVANESLTNALAIKTQENETLTGDLTVSIKKVEQLQAEVTKLAEELKSQTSTTIRMEQTLTDQVQSLELQIKTTIEDKTHLRKQLRMKELEAAELLEVVEQINSNNLDVKKLYEVSQIKAEAVHLREERDELKMKLSDEEGAHQLLEEHVKLVKEEVASLSEQCKLIEKEKKDAETRLEVLTKFYEEREAQRQKEEALRLEKESLFDSEKKEAESILERIQTMQNEILNYKQQIEMLTREILDQEREYKNQIAALETKAHEHWLAARQNERRLEEVKAESSQLRNRLTLVEKNISDGDPDVKLHRLQANGETGPGGHPLLFGTGGGEATSSSPLMFAAGGQGLIPPPPVPSGYLYGPPPPFPPPLPFLPPPASSSSSSVNNPGTAGAANEHVGSRPPPLGGGRLSSPPPPPSSSNNPAGSPPLSPPPSLMPFPPPHHHLPPPLFDVPPLNHHHHMPPPPLPLRDLPHHHHHHQHHHQPPPPPPPPPSNAHTTSWGDDTLPPPAFLRNPSGFHPPQQQQQARDQRARNHKGSLHSSGESLDKSHHGGKV